MTADSLPGARRAALVDDLPSTVGARAGGAVALHDAAADRDPRRIFAAALPGRLAGVHARRRRSIDRGRWGVDDWRRRVIDRRCVVIGVGRIERRAEIEAEKETVAAMRATAMAAMTSMAAVPAIRLGARRDRDQRRDEQSEHPASCGHCSSPWHEHQSDAE